jgi:hypothetical protein
MEHHNPCGCESPPDDFPVGLAGRDGGTVGRSDKVNLKGYDG